MSKGKVILVGAGPGDDGLLTIKGAKEIEKADVIVFDRLVGENIINMLPEKAEKINVGKNAGNHPVPQEKINEILLNKALEGKRIVRLKGGDSFVFGRGGEELELLKENNIDFEVVPGITSAIAAAAYAGIPVTHRDYCSSLHIITGHKRENKALDLDYKSLVGINGTLIFLMSVSNAGEIANGLISNGMDIDMPCAVIENGTRPYQRKVISSLKNIAQDIEKENIKSPAIIVVGKVCSLSEKFDWFDKMPLKGRKIIVSRTKNTSSKMITALKEKGADVKIMPAIKTKSVDFEMPDLSKYNIAVFTSSAGVDGFFEKLYAIKKDARSLSSLKFACVGTETAKALEKYGIFADFVPSKFTGKVLAEEMTEKGFCSEKDSVILFRGNMASDEILDVLKSKNINFTEITVYETDFESCDKVDVSGYEFVTLTSASCVESFIKNADNLDKESITALCIGPKTEEAALKYSLKTVTSKEATIKSLVEKLEEICND